MIVVMYMYYIWFKKKNSFLNPFILTARINICKNISFSFSNEYVVLETKFLRNFYRISKYCLCTATFP
ncbi:Uncharacterised protein [Klebsiella pneumoniae]|uniref:Uncharacterized protein n=1 Tax=Klebsiella pneumoniae TaxID=573 RepID=A0A8B4VGF5_KLEPN|nr:hypothetical protein LT22_03338 [Klebsiella pneumoniae]CAA0338958.1 Uncharacterised protein [Klebsiella pneumoniae]CAE6002429.1 hypothetical protein AI2594V1_1587 [Klebsiella pneumoniae]CAF2391008.1 hypothetical protein AI2829V1_1629 [Klebsiella pneumoniae]CAF2679625.1 hypothetical protein AI2886V1_1583 [Klebsiella pneumoniae]